jgi:TolA-binding protein
VASIAAPLSPEQLLERIAELRKEGRHEEADKALAELRQRYPDYRISDEMLKKVERPK